MTTTAVCFDGMDGADAAECGNPAVQHPLTRESLQALLGFRVVDFAKYVSVFTHKSAAREAGQASYERLEFIGDSVINFVIAKYLYDKYPGADEGYLTRVRTKLVSGKCLSSLAWNLGLQNYVVMNQKALRKGWNSNPRILEDVYEALVGALYMDLGLATAKTFVLTVMERFVNFEDVVRDTNYKDILMRYAQARAMPLPEYRMVSDPQETRNPVFEVAVHVNGQERGRGYDKCKRDAEQAAAHRALTALCVPLE